MYSEQVGIVQRKPEVAVQVSDVEPDKAPSPWAHDQDQECPGKMGIRTWFSRGFHLEEPGSEENQYRRY